MSRLASRLSLAACLCTLMFVPARIQADQPGNQLLPPLEELPSRNTSATTGEAKAPATEPAAKSSARDRKDPFQAKYEEALRQLTRAQIALRNAKTDEAREAAEKADAEAKRILTAISKQRNAAI